MVPCKECLMRPACQHKHYIELLRSCDKLNEFLLIPELRDSGGAQKREHKKRFVKFYHLLKPTKWGNITETSYGYNYEAFRKQ